MQLKDRVIIIIDDCQEFGRTMGEYLAGKDVRLVLIDLNHERLGEAVATCKVTGGNTRVYVYDVVGREQVTHMVAQIVSDFSAINGLVNNAGVLHDGLAIEVKDGRLSRMSLAQWQSVIDVNLTGVFLCAREAAVKVIKLKNGGTIVNISSISRAGNMGRTDYSVTRAGVAADIVIQAKELARYGICVAGVAPGSIETEITAGMEPKALEKMTVDIPLKRTGKPVEIAHSAAHIFENNYYTGRVLELDGGLRLQAPTR